MRENLRARRIAIIIFWIAVWQIAGMLIDNSIVFVGPADVLRSFSQLVREPDFWRSIANSFGKISAGFLSAFLCGILLGGLAYCKRLLKDMLEPVVALMKSIPVASFVILALIWIGSKNLSVFISFTVVFPVIYINTIAGLESTDPQLLEMARVFSIRLPKQIHYIYIPALLPYLVSGCKVALGMSWKSGIAAEVIGVPANTIGENLYMAKIYLSTADLFAWTIVIIIVSSIFEKLFLLLIQAGSRQLWKGGSSHAAL